MSAHSVTSSVGVFGRESLEVFESVSDSGFSLRRVRCPRRQRRSDQNAQHVTFAGLRVFLVPGDWKRSEGLLRETPSPSVYQANGDWGHDLHGWEL